jgi:hypothetical protein
MSLNGQLGAAQLGALPLAGWRKEASGSGLLSAAAQLGALPLFLSGFALLCGATFKTSRRLASRLM